MMTATPATLRRVLDRVGGPALEEGRGPHGVVLFIPREVLVGGGPGILELTWDEYVDLGAPAQITVTIQADDQLTEPDEDPNDMGHHSGLGDY